MFDIDGDGVISINELMAVMASVGNELSPEDAEDIFEAVDIDGKLYVLYDDEIYHQFSGRYWFHWRISELFFQRIY